jgi:hypothetical protein
MSNGKSNDPVKPPQAEPPAAASPTVPPHNSVDIIKKWANLKTGPGGDAILGELWLQSKDPSAGVWAVGAQTLAANLRTYALPGQNITTTYISAFQKKTVDDLTEDLGW